MDPNHPGFTPGAGGYGNHHYGGGGYSGGGGGGDPSNMSGGGEFYHHHGGGGGGGGVDDDDMMGYHGHQGMGNMMFHGEDPRMMAFDVSAGGGMSFDPHNHDNGMMGYPRHHPSSAAHAEISEPHQHVEPGFYYPVEGMRPELHGAPVSALAYDTEYQAIFVASETQSLSRGGGGGGGRHHHHHNHHHRASMMVTQSTIDGMLYSSVPCHPEAPPKVLNALYDTIYGSPAPVVATAAAAGVGRRHGNLPNHAFRPWYATQDPALPENGPLRVYQMGIRTLLPTGQQQQGYVASVSPSAVRLHAHGGLQLADSHVEGMLCGTLHPHHQDGPATHLTVGGQALSKDITNQSGKQQVMCMDMWQDLRVVASYSTDRPSQQRTDSTTTTGTASSTAVTAIATVEARSAIVAGCSDGTVRMLDSRLREMAKIRSHAGGVVSLAVSPDGTLLATTGYGSRGQPGMGSLYAFPDNNVFLYDMRYLGRGGIPHPFVGVGAGPRFVEFLPDMEGLPSNRFVVASGQATGGLQILEPFQETVHTVNANNFIIPLLARGETITAMNVTEDRLALGTSRGNVVQYNMAGFKATQKKVLELPPFTPPPPALSIDPMELNSPDPSIRNGMTDTMKSIFSAYILTKEATLSSLRSPTSFGPLTSRPLVEGSNLRVSTHLMQKASHAVDFLETISTADLGVDLFENHSPPKKHSTTPASARKILQNPNKLLQTTKLYRLAYEESLNRSKKGGRKNNIDDDDEGTAAEDNRLDIPSSYRLTMRPSGKLAGVFSYSDCNASGILPGWDYPPTMPNAFVPSILMLLYCIPETRQAMLDAQSAERPNVSWKDKTLTPEIGFLFHRIDVLARIGFIYPSSIPGKGARLEAWAPTNFMSCLASTPEAEQLQILDGSPAAVDTTRRAEAFYRFLLYQIDKEAAKASTPKVMDPFCGMDFTSVNEFVSGTGPPTTSSTRGMTVELYYEHFLNRTEQPCSFGEVLQQTLCRDMRLRAWNQKSSSYETIVQRKIATSLPTLLSISCACAGRREEEGLRLWRGNIPFGWLPEKIEIELAENGNVIVRELGYDRDTKEDTWKTYEGTKSVPAAVAEIIAQTRKQGAAFKRRYQLEAVVSLVRDDYDRKAADDFAGVASGTDPFGHQVLHVRITKPTAVRVLKSQIAETMSVLNQISTRDMTNVNSSDSAELEKRQQYAQERVRECETKSGESDWYLMNGYSVSKSTSQDARAFHQKFKEPSICIFRAEKEDSLVDAQDEPSSTLTVAPAFEKHSFSVPLEILRTQSLTNGSKSAHASNQRPNLLPGEGDYVAFDAEFVSVQEEVSTLTDSGTKVTIQEPRHVIARISVLDCQTMNILLDDWVVPREPVVDYLTRFSGIVAKDLDPQTSTHHLISTRAAHLKLRLLIDRGCIFVGHGLKQDFWTANVVVPPSQIVDTVEVYHKPAQRYISLRFLANFVLQRDMQQDIHDSVEDATAAYELFQKARTLKQQGDGAAFEALLDDLYAHGQKTDWKIMGGVDPR